MTISLQAVHVATGGPDEEGRLVFADGRLVAVLVRLTEQHEELAGDWFVEVGFGPVDGKEHPVFHDIGAAQEWIEGRLARAAAHLTH